MKMAEKSKSPKKRGPSKGKRKKNMYFTKEHENAIVRYALSEDNKEKTRLYIDYIQPAFDEMVDKIVYTYKFNGLPNIEVLRDDCKNWLVTILDKFDPSKNSKAFAYFTVVTKHWFIHKIKKNSRSAKIECQYEESQAEIERSQKSFENPYEKHREWQEFWGSLWSQIDSWEERMNIKENDRKVYEAVKILLNSHEDIDIFNKKAIYLYLREITKLNTKQIVNSLTKMRKWYVEFKKSWDEGKI
jgi:hypothetical protein